VVAGSNPAGGIRFRPQADHTGLARNRSRFPRGPRRSSPLQSRRRRYSPRAGRRAIFRCQRRREIIVGRFQIVLVGDQGAVADPPAHDVNRERRREFGLPTRAQGVLTPDRVRIVAAAFDPPSGIGAGCVMAALGFRRIGSAAYLANEIGAQRKSLTQRVHSGTWLQNCVLCSAARAIQWLGGASPGASRRFLP
jgi:hypothetical protein